MRYLLCYNTTPKFSVIPISQQSHSSKNPKFVPKPNPLDRTPKNALIGAISGALSLALLLSSPSSPIALESPSPSLQFSPPSSSASDEYCREEDFEDRAESGSEPELTNEGIVEEAWEIVNDSFLDAGRHRWSPETWQRKKEDIKSTSIQTRSKAHDIIKRMLASLGDPYTRFLSPDQFSKMARYDLSGIGINIREVPDENGGVKLKVLGLVLDGPAHSAGVRQGDEVLSVNGMDVSGKSAFEVLSLLQGPNETSVSLKVKHGNCGPVQSVEVERQVAARTPVFYRFDQVENGSASVGYMRLKEFNALARKDLIIAMTRLQDMGVSYFILDLRDNLGGLVQNTIIRQSLHDTDENVTTKDALLVQLLEVDGYFVPGNYILNMSMLCTQSAELHLQAGIEIAKLFLNEGDTVIYTVGRDSQHQQTIVANTSPMTKAPVVVLVNNNTASASEIVASALHDNCRAVLVGERTFGKGLIQSVFELHDGSGVVVTVGKYVTPNHKDINGNGIEPDYRNFPGRILDFWEDKLVLISYNVGENSVQLGVMLKTVFHGANNFSKDSPTPTTSRSILGNQISRYYFDLWMRNFQIRTCMEVPKIFPKHGNWRYNLISPPQFFAS